MPRLDRQQRLYPFSRPRLKRWPLALAAVTTLALALAAASDRPAQGLAIPVAGAGQTPPSPLFGVSHDWSQGLGPTVAAIEQEAGRRPQLVNDYVDLTEPFDQAFAAGAVRQGLLPMVTFEPWLDPSAGPDQPGCSLRVLLRGRYDHELTAWATAARRFGRPLLLRFAPEMNGDWNSWSAGENGNSAAQFVALWRHVHALFQAAGAGNVIWVWSVNVDYPGSTPLFRLYPGDRYVDWVAVDGYNWGDDLPGRKWQSFSQVFDPTLHSLARLTSRPLMLSEVASSERGGSKAHWLQGFFQGLAKRPRIRAFVWFDFDKEQDWRIDSSPAALLAFRRGLAQLR